MESDPKRAFSTRLPAEDADLLEAAIEETDTNTPEFLRRVVRYYLRKNPDRIEVLYPKDSIERWFAEIGE
jgi:hypothetical protein